MQVDKNRLKMCGDGNNGGEWFLSSPASRILGAHSAAKTDVICRLPELYCTRSARSLAPLATQDLTMC